MEASVMLQGGEFGSIYNRLVVGNKRLINIHIFHVRLFLAYGKC